jgi:hypothetical protein
MNHERCLRVCDYCRLCQFSAFARQQRYDPPGDVRPVLPALFRAEAIIIELHGYLKVGCNDAFESGTAGFGGKWLRAENVYLSRGNFMRPGV